MADSKSIPRSEDEILELLKTIARTELELKPEQIAGLQPDTDIASGLQLDSLKQVVLLANIEDAFGFELSLVDRRELQELATVADLVRFIQSRVD